MDSQFFTDDLSSIRIFKGLDTGRDIRVNGDTKGRTVLLRVPSMSELGQVIEEYESKRISTWWDEFILSVCNEGSAYPNQRVPFARAFRATLINRKNKDGIVKDARLNYFKHEAIKRILNLDADFIPSDYVISLPLDSQLALLKKIRPSTPSV
jgi:hypothetical protein